MVELEIRNDVKYTTDEQAAWKPIYSSRDSPRFDTIDTSPLRVCLTMDIVRHPRQQIRPETLRSVDQRFLYQQIGPEKLLSLVDQCFYVSDFQFGRISTELSSPPAEADSKATASKSSHGRYL